MIVEGYDVRNGKKQRVLITEEELERILLLTDKVKQIPNEVRYVNYSRRLGRKVTVSELRANAS